MTNLAQCQDRLQGRSFRLGNRNPGNGLVVNGLREVSHFLPGVGATWSWGVMRVEKWSRMISKLLNS